MIMLDNWKPPRSGTCPWAFGIPIKFYCQDPFWFALTRSGYEFSIFILDPWLSII